MTRPAPPAPEPGAARRFFDAIAPRYDRTYAPSRDESRRKMERVLAKLPPKATILDLGVGTGRELPALLDAGHVPTGVDFSQEMLAICARRARPIPLVHADFWEPLPFADESFDAVLALHGTLAHPRSAADAANLVRSVGRVLRPGGRFVFELPTPRWVEALTVDVPSVADREVVATFSRDGVTYVDRPSGARIAAVVEDEATWRGRFDRDRWSDVDVDTDDPFEMMITATILVRE